jgi:hypothetical protein
MARQDTFGRMRWSRAARGAALLSARVTTRSPRIGVVMCWPPYRKPTEYRAGGSFRQRPRRSARVWHAQGTIKARLLARSRHGGLCSVVAAVCEIDMHWSERRIAEGGLAHQRLEERAGTPGIHGRGGGEVMRIEFTTAADNAR